MARTIVNPATNSSLSSSVMRTELQTLETEVADTTTGHTHNGVDSRLLPSSSVTPAGSDTQIQYNNAGAMGASANLKWSNSSNIIGIGNPVIDNTLPDGLVPGIVFADDQVNTFAAVQVQNAAGANTSGTELDIYSGNGNGSGAGGTVGMQAGAGGSTGAGGLAFLAAGAGNGTSSGGDVRITSGTGGSGGGNGGNIFLNASSGSGGGTQGKVKIWSNNASQLYAILDGSLLSGTDKTFTFPNSTGTLVLQDNTVPLTNKTYNGLVVAGVSTNSTLSITNAKTYTYPTITDTLSGTTSTQTLTNKRITSRVWSTTTTSVIAPEKANFDIIHLTALATALTIANPPTTPNDGDQIRIRILDSGQTRVISYGTQYVAKGGVALTTTTSTSKNLELGFEWNTNLSAYNLLTSAQE